MVWMLLKVGVFGRWADPADPECPAGQRWEIHLHSHKRGWEGSEAL